MYNFAYRVQTLTACLWDCFIFAGSLRLLAIRMQIFSPPNSTSVIERKKNRIRQAQLMSVHSARARARARFNAKPLFVYFPACVRCETTLIYYDALANIVQINRPAVLPDA